MNQEITALIATRETSPEEIERSPLVVTKHGALIKNRHGAHAPDNNLQCTLTKMTVAETEVNLHFPDGECCDMEAAVRLSTQANPAISRIQTWSGEKRDTEYRKSEGKWNGILARQGLPSK